MSFLTASLNQSVKRVNKLIDDDVAQNSWHSENAEFDTRKYKVDIDFSIRIIK